LVCHGPHPSGSPFAGDRPSVRQVATPEVFSPLSSKSPPFSVLEFSFPFLFFLDVRSLRDFSSTKGPPFGPGHMFWSQPPAPRDGPPIFFPSTPCSPFADSEVSLLGHGLAATGQSCPPSIGSACLVHDCPVLANARRASAFFVL